MVTCATNNVCITRHPNAAINECLALHGLCSTVWQPGRFECMPYTCTHTWLERLRSWRLWVSVFVCVCMSGLTPARCCLLCMLCTADLHPSREWGPLGVNTRIVGPMSYTVLQRTARLQTAYLHAHHQPRTATRNHGCRLACLCLCRCDCVPQHEACWFLAQPDPVCACVCLCLGSRACARSAARCYPLAGCDVSSLALPR